MKKPKLIENKVVIGPCRLSYTHLMQRYSFNGGSDDGGYSTNILIPKEEKETVEAIRAAIKCAEGIGVTSKWQGKKPNNLALPLRDGAEKEDEVYQGCWFLNAKCKTRPGVVDADMNPIMDEEEVYSGMWAYVSVTFYPYSVNGNKGIACGLNNVKKFKDDERLGGRVSAERDFSDFDVDDDDL